jgi:hypothetical protein
MAWHDVAQSNWTSVWWMSMHSKQRFARHGWRRVGLCLTLIGAWGCKRPWIAAPANDEFAAAVVQPKTVVAESSAVVFDISRSSDVAPPGTELYNCVYTARGKTARFGIQIRQKRTVSGAPFPIAMADGKLLAVAGSDNSTLLEDLMKALQAKRLPMHSTRADELAFDAAVLGQRQSQTPNGGFSSKPPGDWKVIKLFLPKGGDEGEMFLDLNPVSGKAEFSLKDSDYGDYLLEQLATVL